MYLYIYIIKHRNTNEQTNFFFFNIYNIVKTSQFKFPTFVTELNATKSTESSGTQEDVLYQKDVSFSAELEVATSNRIKTIVKEKHIDDTDQTYATMPSRVKNETKSNYTFTAERSKEIDGIKSLIEDGVSDVDLNIITDDKSKGIVLEASAMKVTTLGPSLEQKVS